MLEDETFLRALHHVLLEVRKTATLVARFALYRSLPPAGRASGGSDAPS